MEIESNNKYRTRNLAIVGYQKSNGRKIKKSIKIFLDPLLGRKMISYRFENSKNKSIGLFE